MTNAIQLYTKVLIKSRMAELENERMRGMEKSGLDNCYNSIQVTLPYRICLVSRREGIPLAPSLLGTKSEQINIPLSSPGEPLLTSCPVSRSTENYQRLPRETRHPLLRSCLVLYVNLFPGHGPLHSPTYRGRRIDHRHVVAILERRSKRRYQCYQRKQKCHFLQRGKKTHKHHLRRRFGF